MTQTTRLTRSVVLVDDEAEALARRACMPCHCHELEWSWYAHVPPAIDDTSRSQTTPLLQHVTGVIRPVTFLGDRFLDIVFGKHAIARDPRERRFFNGHT